MALIQGLLLAGGCARRFGGDKLLAPLPGSEPSIPVVVSAARTLLEALESVLAVVPLGGRALRAALAPLGCEILESDRTALGMGASLAAGVAATECAGGWMVALGDMPLVRVATVRAVRSALEEGALLAAPVSVQSGARGHPVGFAAPLRSELLALQGDTGAREVIVRHRDALRLLPCDDPGIFIDLDTPQQLAALARRHS